MTTLEQYQIDGITEIVKADLDQRFAGEYEFNFIVRDPVESVYGGEYIPVIVLVVNGNGEILDPRWLNGVVRRIRPKLAQIGVSARPSLRYVDESEWYDTDYYAAGEE